MALSVFSVVTNGVVPVCFMNLTSPPSSQLLSKVSLFRKFFHPSNTPGKLRAYYHPFRISMENCVFNVSNFRALGTSASIMASICFPIKPIKSSYTTRRVSYFQSCSTLLHRTYIIPERVHIKIKLSKCTISFIVAKIGKR